MGADTLLHAALLKNFEMLNDTISKQISRSFQTIDVRSYTRILNDTITDICQSAMCRQNEVLASRLRLVQNRAENLCDTVAKSGDEATELSSDVCARAEKLAEQACDFLPNQSAVQAPKRMTFAEFWQMVGVLVNLLALVYQIASNAADKKQRSAPLPEQCVVDRVDFGADFAQHGSDVNQCAMLVLDAVDDCFQQLAREVPVTRDEHLGQREDNL